MQKLLLINALIVTLDEDRPDYFYGDLRIEGNAIAAIAIRPHQLTPATEEKVIDLNGYLLMPGFINTHGHAAMSLLRGLADDLNLLQWLEEEIWPIEEHLESDDIYYGTMLAIAEMIKSGTTTFTDMYFFVDRIAEAVEKSGIRAVLSRGLIGIGDSKEAALEDTKTLIKKWHGAAGERISISIGPHAPYTCPPPFLKEVAVLAAESGLLVQIHLSETLAEVEESLKAYGKRPPAVVAETGLFDCPVIAAHCVHLDDHDIDILVKHNVAVAHNQGSNLKLGSGIAPLAKMLRAGLTVGLGTDGPASNNNLDMIEEMRFASLVAKGIDRDPTLIDAKATLKLATLNGAKALRLDKLGCLKEGCLADMIALYLKAPHLTPLFSPMAHLAYSAAAADVRYVIVDGQILLDNGRLTTINEEEILARASKAAFNLVERSRAQNKDETD